VRAAAARLGAALPLLLASSCLAQEEAPAEGGAAVDVDVEALAAAAFAPERLRARRRALVEALPEGAVVVVATPAGNDTSWRVFPDPDFLYLSGQRDLGLSLLLTAGEDVLFAPAADRHDALWNGERLTVGSPRAAASGFAAVVDRSEREARLRAALADGGTLYLAGATDLEALGLDDDLPRERVASARPRLAGLRQVKDDAEVALLQFAVDVTTAALTEACRSIRPGQREYEAEAVIEHVFARYGAQRPGFASIVGAGPNSCVLHYNANRGPMAAGDLVVMDVGAEVFGYTADVTRTVPVAGTFTPRQREVYEAVLAAQGAAIAAVKPGVTLRDVHRAARRSIEEAGFGAHFPHSTSHWLGLEVHDVGHYRRALAPGMVLTIEPGIYIAAEEIGVRIEDDVVVTADGCRVLSDGVPRDPAAIEALMTGEGLGARPVAPLPGRGRPRAPGGQGERPRYFDLRPR